MAPGKKNARRLGAHIVFVDESGFLLIPPTKRTWAPRGETPILFHRLRHDRLSAISGVSVSPVRRHVSLYFKLYPHNISQQEVLSFLRHLIRHIPGHIIILWDRWVTHRGKLVKEYVGRHPRLHLEYLPAYAPDLNPDEGVWSQLKSSLANGRPDDICDLEGHLLACLADLRSSQPKLRACVHQSQLPLF